MIALCLLAVAAAGGRQPVSERNRNLLEILKILTAENLAGRAAGSIDALATADSLATWFAGAGLEPGFADGWFQPFALEGSGWSGEDLTGRMDRNVAGLLRGRGDLERRYLVVGAHFDHLGRVDAADSNTLPERGAYYPGANDNASGVAVLVELARQLVRGDRGPTTDGDRRSILFVAFAAEEVGLQGSGYLVANPPIPLSRIDAVINLDTVGQMRDDKLHVGGVGTAHRFEDLVARANADALDLVLSRSAWSGSDHMVFNTRQVPVLFLFTGAYPEYNRPTDDWPVIDLEGLSLAYAFTERLVELIRYDPETFTWIEIAARDLRPDAAADQNRDTWFGSLPDFTEGIEGYAIAGVFDESPAARAGLQKGDVLIRLAGREITDLATFTEALRAHDPGDMVEVLVVRDGHTLPFTLVLGSRSERR